MKGPLLHIKLLEPEPTKTPLLAGHSWLMSGVAVFSEMTILGFGADHTRKDPSMGRVFSALAPDDDGFYEAELGVSLPDLLPNLGSHPESILDTKDRAGQPVQMCLSNQMRRIRYVREGANKILLYPAYFQDKLEEVSPEKFPVDAPPENLRTSVTRRFRIAGADAEAAIVDNFDRCVKELMESTNLLLLSLHVLRARGENIGIYAPSYGYNLFDLAYLVMRGRDSAQYKGARVSVNLYRLSMRPPVLTSEQTAYVREVVGRRGEPDIAERLLSSARSHLDAGHLEYALLLLVVAAETAVAKHVRERLLAMGVSSSKLDDCQDTMTYSRMLNVDLQALSDSSAAWDAAELGVLNAGRKARNELMHEGRFGYSDRRGTLPRFRD